MAAMPTLNRRHLPNRLHNIDMLPYIPRIYPHLGSDIQHEILNPTQRDLGEPLDAAIHARNGLDDAENDKLWR